MGALFTWLWGMISDTVVVFWNVLSGFLVYLFDTFFSWVVDLLDYVMAFLVNGACYALTLIEVSFTDLEEVMVVTGKIVYVANIYLPMALITSLLTAYGAAAVSVYGIRLIIKLIPTIG